jgi:hypothetical protein
MPTKSVKRRTPAKRTSVVARRKATVKPIKKTAAKKTPLLLRPLKHLRSRGFVKLPAQKKKWMLPVTFAVLFGVIGCYFLIRSMAAGGPLEGANGEFTAVTPARILDTRTGMGGYNTPIGHDKTITVQVAGQGGVPASNVKAVVMNVTITGPTAPGYLTIWPNGLVRPNSSNVNFNAGQTIANQVTVPVSADGKVQIYNATGSTNVIFDVAGYYQDTQGARGSRFMPLTPDRILDTRTGIGGYSQAVGQDKSISVQVRGSGGVPASATAVVLNLTATQPTIGGYATVWPTGQPRPNSSVINFVAGQTIANLVTVPIGPDGTIQIYNATGSTHFIVDTSGYFEPVGSGYEATQDGRFISLSPNRILDTRTGMGGINTPVGQGQTITPTIAGAGYLPPTNVRAVILNVTAVNTTATSYLTIWPSGVARPNSSVINFAAGQTIANQVTVPVGADGKIQLFNALGSTDVIFDVAGYYLETYETNMSQGGSINIPYPINYQQVPTNKLEIDFVSSTIPQTAGHNQLQFNYDLRYDYYTKLFIANCFPDTMICKPLDPNAKTKTFAGQPGYIEYETPYPYIVAGKTSTLIYEVLTNQPGFDGTWLFASIKDQSTGITRKLHAYKYLKGDHGYLHGHLDAYFTMQTSSCKDTRQYSVNLSNLKVNGRTGLAETPYVHVFSEPYCPGMSRVDVTMDTANPKALKIAAGTLGVPQANRNVSPPVIQITRPSKSSLSVNVTDNLASTHVYADIDGAFIPADNGAGWGPLYSTNVTYTYNISSYSPGQHRFHVWAVDNTGLAVEKTIDITL